MLRETELRGEVTRARSDADELASILARTTRERDEAQARASGLDVDLAAARAEGLALGTELEAARSRSEAASAGPAEPVPAGAPAEGAASPPKDDGERPTSERPGATPAAADGPVAVAWEAGPLTSGAAPVAESPPEPERPKSG
jgi:hypothetical protein